MTRVDITIKERTVIHQGFSHSRHYFYRSELDVLAGYRLVNKGKSRLNDLIMVHVPPFPKAKSCKRYLGKEAKIKAKWELIKEENIGIDVSRFKAVIRQGAKEK